MRPPTAAPAAGFPWSRRTTWVIDSMVPARSHPTPGAPYSIGVGDHGVAVVVVVTHPADKANAKAIGVHPNRRSRVAQPDFMGHLPAHEGWPVKTVGAVRISRCARCPSSATT